MFLSRSKNLRSVPAKYQQGVAIITALLIVTIATTVSITIATRLQLDVRRTGNLIAQDQAQFYLLAAEEWSQRILRQDKKDSTIDSLDESWAFELPPLPVDGGSIQGTLTDLHACINVNSLLAGGAVDAISKARLTQLFKKLGVKNDLTQAITDWIDGDLETSNPNGAEDGYYLNLETPYRTANTPLHSISELRLVKGFEDSETYELVKPYLCAFILDGGEMTINVNTASAEVLQSLSENMTAELAADIIERRDEEPFNDIKEFTSFAKLDTIIKNTKKLSTSSDYFLLRTQAIIGRANKVMYSVIYREDNGNTKIISRTQRTL
ncbi:MAG: type II secretion system minor pseudopilin GspK [Gammaproteobacteria bacterium]|nr:type II secretion system minor pseudopilin GspK [Gammaproteobacteria bacterium]